jgi:hypothetical protein
VSTYNTDYTANFYAQNADGQNSLSGTFTSGYKALDADASAAFGNCTDNPSKYCGADSNIQPGPSFTNSTTEDVPGGTTVEGVCQTTGGDDTGTYGAYDKQTSDVWIEMQSSIGNGYMSVLWFQDPSTAADNLPGC